MVIRELTAFGRRVRARRRAAKLTQTQLAERAYLRKHFIWRIECEQANPSLATIALIADALGCEIADLFQATADFP
jgi:transcriptional regulator with XRE-family HTH domain